jgi:hypothetical protein
MKKSFSMLELIVVVVLLSVVFVANSTLALKIYEINELNYMTAIDKIELENTKLFLEKQLSSGVDIGTKLSQIPQTNHPTSLTYKGKVLLQNVTKFKITKLSSLYHIDICLQNRRTNCKSWVF